MIRPVVLCLLLLLLPSCVARLSKLPDGTYTAEFDGRSEVLVPKSQVPIPPALPNIPDQHLNRLLYAAFEAGVRMDWVTMDTLLVEAKIRASILIRGGTRVPLAPTPLDRTLDNANKALQDPTKDF